MNKFAFGAALTALSLAMPGVAVAQRAAPAVIVVVDTDRIYRDCNACRTAQTQLTAQMNAAQQRAVALGQPIQTEQQSIEQAARAAANQQGAARTAAETALQQRFTQLQGRQTAAAQELQRLQQNLQSTQTNVLRQINARLNPIITQVMNSRGANIAVDTNATLSHAPALDVTTEVLNALNQQLPSISVTPLPQQQQQPAGR